MYLGPAKFLNPQIVTPVLGIINPSGTMIPKRCIYKIVEPVVLTAVVFLVLASSDLAIDPEFSR